MPELNLKWAKKGVVGSVIAILILTVLEFPPPIGFETRSQANVSIFWLIFFLAIFITEIATIPLIFKRPKLGVQFAFIAGALNIIQIFADQVHLMQPEVAPLGYTLLEISVGFISLALIYFAWVTKKKN
ncbi:MAG: hypothetical protein PHC61_00195 [Chitinivibrionales bacterium]|nr:hypothetical protein [Chitinivibrionales bacterium]